MNTSTHLRWAAAGTAAVATFGVVAATPHVPAAAATSHATLAASTVKTVTNTNDKGAGSLRAAIFKVNNPSLNFDTIEFNLSGTAPYMIVLNSPLPALTAPVTIDGYSQPGTARATDTQSATLSVVIAYPVDVSSDGLVLNTDDSLIAGLVVEQASGDGIIVNGDHNTLAGNYVGTTYNGELRAGNDGNGITIVGDSNTVGGESDPGDRNLISTNGEYGISVSGSGNTIVGNRIGTDDDGEQERGNVLGGIDVVTGNDNVIGGATPNLVSGNAGPGIVVEAAAAADVSGNVIGTNVEQSAAIANEGPGVSVLADDIEVSGNVIAGNTDDGISVYKADRATILGNQIGVTGAVPMTKIGNGGDGIDILGGSATIGEVDAGNTIAGNGGNGVRLKGDGERVQSNSIGTDSGGTLGLGDASDGVFLVGSESWIGGDDPALGNLISGNIRNGVHVVAPGGAHGAVNDYVVNNLIGTDPSGNGPNPNHVNGVLLDASLVQVRTNRIAFNGSDGIEVLAGTNDPITGNSIDQNGDLGIDLLPFAGVTANDDLDPDTGANDLVNFPFVTSATTNVNGTLVTWEVRRSLPLTYMQLEFFASDACDTASTTNGEGAVPLGTVVIKTDKLGNRVGGTQLPGFSASGQVATGTATLVPAISRPTSEFGPCTPIT